jgi:hypothetical protein
MTRYSSADSFVHLGHVFMDFWRDVNLTLVWTQQD